MNFVEKTIRAKQMFERYKELLPQYLNRQITTLYVVLEDEFGLSDRQIRRDIDYYMYSSLCPIEDRQAVNNILAAQPTQKPQPVNLRKVSPYTFSNWEDIMKLADQCLKITEAWNHTQTLAKAQKMLDINHGYDYTEALKGISRYVPETPLKKFDNSFWEKYVNATYPTLPNIPNASEHKPA